MPDFAQIALNDRYTLLPNGVLAVVMKRCRLNELARFPATFTDKALRFNAALTLWGDCDLNCFVQPSPPTLTVTLIEPSSSCWSMTE